MQLNDVLSDLGNPLLRGCYFGIRDGFTPSAKRQQEALASGFGLGSDAAYAGQDFFVLVCGVLQVGLKAAL